jgi:hypothetical protein
MTTLDNLSKKAALLSDSRDELRVELLLLDGEMQAVKNAHIKRLQQLTRAVIKHEAELSADIEANTQLFVKPRSQIIDGIKFGLQKQKGSLTWDNTDTVLNRMDDLFNKGDIDRAVYDVCVETKYSLVVAGLEKLEGKLLKKLGITISADTDKVLIKSVDSDVEKMLNAVIKDALKQAKDSEARNGTD